MTKTEVITMKELDPKMIETLCFEQIKTITMQINLR